MGAQRTCVGETSPDLGLNEPQCLQRAASLLWSVRLRQLRHYGNVVLSGMVVAAGKKAKHQDGRHRARTAGQITHWATEALSGSKRSAHAHLRETDVTCLHPRLPNTVKARSAASVTMTPCSGARRLGQTMRREMPWNFRASMRPSKRYSLSMGWKSSPVAPCRGL